MTITAVLSSLLAIFLSLAFVIALAWGTLYLLKRFQDGSFGKLGGAQDGRELRFIRALPIGPRERLVLVEVDGEEMLLGVTAHSISQLREWPSRDLDGKIEAGLDQPLDGAAGENGKRPRFRLRMADRGE